MIWLMSGIGITFLLVLLIKAMGLGNWRITLNQVISSYTGIKKMNPALSDKEVFMSVLDERYRVELYYAKKEKAKGIIEKEVEGGWSILNKYNLPILIYLCLVIEKNKILSSYTTVHDMLSVITAELQRQGLKYI
ncbi:hypothetical protein [Clostridium aminobutyricum]|uniref:Uncharacterized protein n=1 Tax=Clostridium aminobutyricum TaxID=33953 RepID=A0A939IIW3_CLOAM|nr:hypothetical protein [Clostridium aminobutyricum]MBN7773486.1 hypothetical protein [Clostridium aminobutyricum]